MRCTSVNLYNVGYMYSAIHILSNASLNKYYENISYMEHNLLNLLWKCIVRKLKRFLIRKLLCSHFFFLTYWVW